jgi:WD40 repeat protein
VAWSPDGGHIVSGSWDNTVRVWDGQSGQQQLCLQGHKSWVQSVACSPDGERIVSGSWDKTVRVWDAASGKQLLCLEGHQDSVENVAYSPDGWRIVSRASDKTVRVWDAPSGECLETIHESMDVWAIARTVPDAPWLAITGVLETAIQSRRTKEVVAWFPAALGRITTHSGGRMWAGAVGNHLYLIALEGA